MGSYIRLRPSETSIELLACYSGFELSHELPEVPSSILTRRKSGFFLELSPIIILRFREAKPMIPRCFPCGVTAAHQDPKRCMKLIDTRHRAKRGGSVTDGLIYQIKTL